MLSGSALATNQPHKRSRLTVRQAPGFASGAVLDDDTTALTRGYLKRARRKRYGHGIPLKQGGILAARSKRRLSIRRWPRSLFDGLLIRRRYSSHQGNYSP
jgi:hypothetical protein